MITTSLFGNCKLPLLDSFFIFSISFSRLCLIFLCSSSNSNSLCLFSSASACNSFKKIRINYKQLVNSFVFITSTWVCCPRLRPCSNKDNNEVLKVYRVLWIQPCHKNLSYQMFRTHTPLYLCNQTLPKRLHRFYDIFCIYSEGVRIGRKLLFISLSDPPQIIVFYF